MKTLSSISAVALMMIGALVWMGCGEGGRGDKASDAIDIMEKDNVTATYQVNTDESNINWMGKMKVLPRKHEGTVKFSRGDIQMVGNQVVGGSFVINMETIENTDLQDPKDEAKLETDLNSDNFFAVETYPTAKFEIASVDPATEADGGTHLVTGNLTMKDITHSISFPATINVNGESITAKAKVTIDRTKWDVRYGSEKFFDNLGDEIISDNIELDVSVAASAKSTFL